MVMRKCHHFLFEYSAICTVYYRYIVFRCKEILMQLPNTVTSDTIHMLLSGMSLFYSLWFITILAPISWRKKKILRNMFVLWCVLAGMRVIFLFDPKPMPFMFISDPLNTILFICAGIIIFICMILTQRFQNRQFQ